MLVVVTLLLAGCSSLSQEEQELFNSLPDEAYLPNGASCAGTLSASGATVPVVGFNKVFQQLIYLDRSTSFFMQVNATDFSDLQTLLNCIKSTMGTYGWSPDRPDPGSVLEPGQQAVFQPTQEVWQPPPPLPTPIPPDEFWVQFPDGSRNWFASYDAANAAAYENGGEVWLVRGGEWLKRLESYPAWQKPPEIPGISAAQEYFTNLLTGVNFPTLDQAINEGKTRPDEQTIATKRRGEIVVNPTFVIPRFDSPKSPDGTALNVSPVDVYFASPAGSFLSAEDAFNATAATSEGGDVTKMIRGEAVETVVYVAPWTPPDKLISQVPDLKLGNQYFEFRGDYFKTKSEAILAAERYRIGTSYPGGNVNTMMRNLVMATDVVGPWELPEVLPEGWDADSTYYVRGGFSYPDVTAAAFGQRWQDILSYGLKDEPLTKARRGVSIAEHESPAKIVWLLLGILGLTLVLLALILLYYRRRQMAAALRKVPGQVVEGLRGSTPNPATVDTATSVAKAGRRVLAVSARLAIVIAFMFLVLYIGSKAIDEPILLLFLVLVGFAYTLFRTIWLRFFWARNGGVRNRAKLG